eukprot:sb/3475103/
MTKLIGVQTTNNYNLLSSDLPLSTPIIIKSKSPIFDISVKPTTTEKKKPPPPPPSSSPAKPVAVVREGPNVEELVEKITENAADLTYVGHHLGDLPKQQRPESYAGRKNLSTPFSFSIPYSRSHRHCAKF